MALKNQKWNKILELFFEFPTKEFTVREISRKTKIPTSSVQRYLADLRKDGFISKENRAVITPYFKFRKTFFIIDRIFKSGLIGYLDDKFNPSCIILFGGARKGEYDKESDIDIFIESIKETKADLAEFEEKMGHCIQLFVEKDINDLNPRLRNNVINGIKLAGYFKIK